MNTNHLKKFAQEGRIKLLSQITAKLEQVLTADSAELRGKAAQIKKLQEAINATSKSQVIDQVAYTWFNRFMALRFMDVNGYQPIGIQVVSPQEGYTLPELLDEAKQGHIPEELNVKRQYIYDLLDGKVPSSNAQNEAYKELLIGACNHLHTVFPFLFERINDYTELLLPEDLTSEFSILQDVRDGMTAEDCEEVEIIGWLYQFYISEKKDEVFASKRKVKKEDIPAATQLFTPRWIVEYMVQNTVGKLWLQNRPHSRLREHMPYFIESPSMDGEEFLKVGSVEEITLLDQACGSGHILVYGFELFAKIYEEEGYNPSEIPQLILEKNLYGYEIDVRAAQLAGFALMMKARGYSRRFFRKKTQPNILCFEDVQFEPNELEQYLEGMKMDLFNQDLITDIKLFEEATNLGSLIQPKTESIPDIEKRLPPADLFLSRTHTKLLAVLRQITALNQKFHCVVANPPYMGSGKMNKKMSEWVKKEYPDSKADLFSCFIERSLEFVPQYGFNGLVTMESWMFLSSFEKFRKKLIENTKIHSLSHFGWHIMRIAFGTVSFILEKAKPSKNFKGVYSYLEYADIQKDINRPIVFPVKNNNRYKHADQKDFEKIPGSPISYWIRIAMLNCFLNKKISDFGQGRIALATGDNNRFLRNWHETTHFKQRSKWIPVNKGGEHRKWYGNFQYTLNWENEGFEIHNLSDKKTGRIRSHNYNGTFGLKKCISWSSISSGNPSFRYTPNGFMFVSGGSCFFLEDESNLIYIMSFLCSKLVIGMMKILSSTMNLEVGQVGKLPFNEKVFRNKEIKDITIECIELSQLEWNSHETSWNFQQNELFKHRADDLEETYDLYQHYWQNKFFQLHKDEEELNKQFIEIYGLQEELTPDVPLEDITILKDELNQKQLKELSNNYKSGWKLVDSEWRLEGSSILKPQLPFDAQDVFAQFMSYAVGCMFGRYSLDKEGLILANQGETLKDYLEKLDLKEAEVSFLPDDDNIIPILDDEWFEDDIVGRFHAFLKVSFGTENFDKNLAFVEECLGKDIRKYFVKDFYKDHIKRYKKRPIYWMFSSPKDSFNVLIYMHRYTPDTLNQIRNDYLVEYREKLKIRSEHLDHIIETGSATEQTKAAKEKDKLKVVLLELQEYERDILYPLATERIAIDLDDGVLVNYNKFGKAIKEVKSLNDKKKKAKVRKFDWIDAEGIRD